MCSPIKKYLGYCAAFAISVLSVSAAAEETSASDALRLAKPLEAPSAFPQEPSLRETGRIGPMFPQGSSQIQRDELGMPAAETTVQQVTFLERKPSPGIGGAGIIDEAVLDREVQARLSSAQQCRIEVARRKQVAPSEVVAAPLTLRWTILPSGGVAATAVTSSTLDDADLADCVKKQMVSWIFTRPRGGPVSVERSFQLNLR